MCAIHASPTHCALQVVVRHARQIKQLETRVSIPVASCMRSVRCVPIRKH